MMRTMTATSIAAKHTTDQNAPGALSSLLFQGQIPGEYLVPEEQVPVVDSLLARPAVQRLIPRGLELKWGTALSSRAARSYRAPYALPAPPIPPREQLPKATPPRHPLHHQ